MGNRNMEAKGLKLRRQKRLFPRYLAADYVPTGKPPNMLVMNELKERTRSLANSDEYADYLVTRMMMDAQGQHPHPGRQEVKAHIQRIQDTAPALMNVVLMNTKLKKVMMFFPSERNRWIIYEEDFLNKTVQTSMVYMDRARCISAWKEDRIRWVHFSSVRPPSID